VDNFGTELCGFQTLTVEGSHSREFQQFLKGSILSGAVWLPGTSVRVKSLMHKEGLPLAQLTSMRGRCGNPSRPCCRIDLCGGPRSEKAKAKHERHASFEKDTGLPICWSILMQP
jgi:hypothetical protein